MRSIFYPDGILPRPYIFNSRDDDYSLYFFSFVFILVCWVLMFRSYSGGGGVVLVQCPAGECATNLQTGVKRCPYALNTVVLADPVTEVCNPSSGCSDSHTPYSLNSDGTFNISGDCASGQTCRCSTQTLCPPFSSVLFDFSGKSITQSQFVGNSSVGGPGVVTNVSREGCFINITDANLLTPSPCNESNFTTPTSILNCIGHNPCINGYLTFVPEKGRDLVANPFNLVNEGLTASMSCIPGSGCDTAHGKAPVFDWSTGKSVCASVY